MLPKYKYKKQERQIVNKEDRRFNTKSDSHKESTERYNAAAIESGFREKLCRS